MSPDARAGLTLLSKLRDEISADRRAIDLHAARIEAIAAQWERASKDEGQLALAALSLHGWYSGFERILERIAREIDERLPTGADSHIELLKQAAVELGGLRPAVVPRALVQTLKELLDFRHFLRHPSFARTSTG